jgi:DNA-binding response OmpR family regulator
MVADLAGKRVLVLSDNNGLAEAIEINLKCSHLEVEKLALRSQGQQYPEQSRRDRRFGSQVELGDFDLIVVAMSSPSSEPVVALARASLTRQIGRVPLLIISDRPFLSDPDAQIIHLDFPFEIDRLHNKVKAILQRDSKPTPGECALERALLEGKCAETLDVGKGEV